MQCGWLLVVAVDDDRGVGIEANAFLAVANGKAPQVIYHALCGLRLLVPGYMKLSALLTQR